MGNAIGRCILGFEMEICLVVHPVRGLDGIANGKGRWYIAGGN